MNASRRFRWSTLLLASSGSLLLSSCVFGQVIDTIETAFDIVDIWV